MSNIVKFFEKGIKEPKTKTKTFRLTETAYNTLEALSDRAGNSQNEIMNEVLEDYWADLTFVTELEQLCSLLTAGNKIGLHKVTVLSNVSRVTYNCSVMLSENGAKKYLVKCFITYSDNTAEEQSSIAPYYEADTIGEILKLGFNSSYSTEMIEIRK